MTKEQKLALDRERFCRDLPLVMNKAGELGPLKTMHALHEAVRVVGYEVADQFAAREKGK